MVTGQGLTVEGTVTTPRRDAGSGILGAYLIVTGAGVETTITVGGMLSGRRFAIAARGRAGRTGGRRRGPAGLAEPARRVPERGVLRVLRGFRGDGAPFPRSWMICSRPCGRTATWAGWTSADMSRSPQKPSTRGRAVQAPHTAPDVMSAPEHPHGPVARADTQGLDAAGRCATSPGPKCRWAARTGSGGTTASGSTPHLTGGWYALVTVTDTGFAWSVRSKQDLAMLAEGEDAQIAAMYQHVTRYGDMTAAAAEREP